MTQREISREIENDYLNNNADIVGQNLWKIKQWWEGN